MKDIVLKNNNKLEPINKRKFHLFKLNPMEMNLVVIR